MTDYDSGYCSGFHNGYYSGYDKGLEDRLEQVIKWLKVNLMKHDFFDGHAYLYDDCSNAYIREEELLKDLRKAMRPTRENN